MTLNNSTLTFFIILPEDLDNIPKDQDEQTYLNQQVKEVYRKLKPLGFSWETIGWLTGKNSGGTYRNIYNDLQNASRDQVKDLKLAVTFVHQIRQFYTGKDVSFDFIQRKDISTYAPIEEKLTIIEEKIDFTLAVADRAIDKEANGNEDVGREIRASIWRNNEKKRKEEAEKLANSKTAGKKKNSKSKPSGKQQKDDTTPPSAEGNNEPV